MTKINLLWFSLISELFVNVTAGWVAAIIIVPNFLGAEFPFNFAILILDFIAAIFCLIIAFLLRKISQI